jgi:hypothetical protein
MTQETPQPPPFNVGESYEDEHGKYKVLSVLGAHMTFERPDGDRGHTDDIPLKARIHNRIRFERDHPRPLTYQRSRAGSGTAEYKYEDVTQLVAAVIDGHSERSTKYIPHSNLKKGLLLDPHARSIIDRIPPTSKFKTPEAWAGVIIAGFSKQWTEGRWARFERKKIKEGHEWRVKKR